jgi:hypothetical protein
VKFFSNLSNLLDPFRHLQKKNAIQGSAPSSAWPEARLRTQHSSKVSLSHLQSKIIPTLKWSLLQTQYVRMPLPTQDVMIRIQCYDLPPMVKVFKVDTTVLHLHNST